MQHALIPARTWAQNAILMNRHRSSVRFGLRVASWMTSAASGAGDWDKTTNGEATILGRMADLGPQVIFDVGANVGDWTRLAAQMLPEATFHAFEPVPTTYAVLEQALRHLDSRVEMNDFGLIDQQGTQEMYLDAERSTVASVVSQEGASTRTAVTCSFSTGDAYCAMRSIDEVAFLKIDAEGADHLVLIGFSDMFQRNAIRVVQFEHGPWALQTHSLLFDKYSFLRSMGYVVGRLYPDGVEFGPFTRGLEDFRLANYVAVPAGDALRHRLSAPR